MTTRYIHTITAICPEHLVNKANHLAGVLGESMLDLNTYNTLNYKDSNGRYSVIQFAGTDSIVSKVNTNTVIRPPFDTNNEIDLEAAQDALDSIEWYNPSLDRSLSEQADEPYEHVKPDTSKLICCLDNTDVQKLITLLELESIGEEL